MSKTDVFELKKKDINEHSYLYNARGCKKNEA